MLNMLLATGSSSWCHVWSPFCDVAYLFVCCCLCCFSYCFGSILRHCLSMQFGIVLGSICLLGWSVTLKDHPASAYRVLQLHKCITIPGLALCFCISVRYYVLCYIFNWVFKTMSK